MKGREIESLRRSSLRVKTSFFEGFIDLVYLFPNPAGNLIAQFAGACFGHKERRKAVDSANSNRAVGTER